MHLLHLLAWLLPAEASECDTTVPEPDGLVLDIVQRHDASGYTVLLEAAGAWPGTPVRFAMGVPSGSDPCPEALGGTCLDLEGVKYLGTGIADEEGIARHKIEVSRRMRTAAMSIQAVSLDCDYPALSQVEDLVIDHGGACAVPWPLWNAPACEATDALEVLARTDRQDGHEARRDDDRRSHRGRRGDQELACWRDAWFDDAMPQGLFIDGEHVDSGPAVADALPTFKGQRGGPYPDHLAALELSLAYDRIGAMGPRDRLADEVIRRGPHRGTTVGEFYARTAASPEPNDIATMNAIFNTFECSPGVFPMPEAPEPEPEEPTDPVEPVPEVDPGEVTCLAGDEGDLYVDSQKVLNAYYAPPGDVDLEAGETAVYLGDARGAFGGIQPGDRLMILQMQGVGIDPGSDVNPHDPYGDGPTGRDRSGYLPGTLTAGTWEIVVAVGTADADGRVPVRGTGPEGGLAHSYVQDRTRAGAQPWQTYQIVRIPQLASLTLGFGGVVLPEPWDGETGGVVAIDVAGTVTFDGGIIDASYAGFRGGQTESLYRNGAGQLGKPGHKGEGVAGPSAKMYSSWEALFVESEVGVPIPPGEGSGAPANGGGNARSSDDAAGGGGANAGDGGIGGSGWYQRPDRNNAGKGASGLYNTDLGPHHLVLGGGGGGAAGDDPIPNKVAGSGQSGGGLVWMRALDFEVVTTGEILADGMGGLDAPAEGGGGGGAGGTVVLVSDQADAAGLLVSARGGKGNQSSQRKDGGGGGGGGGAVYLSGVMNAEVDVAGGEGGFSVGGVQFNDGLPGDKGIVQANPVLTGLLDCRLAAPEEDPTDEPGDTGAPGDTGLPDDTGVDTGLDDTGAPPVDDTGLYDTGLYDTGEAPVDTGTDPGEPPVDEPPAEEEPGDYACGFSQEAWGLDECGLDSVACLRDAWFELVYPDGMSVGGVVFDDAAVVAAMLPAVGDASTGIRSAYFGELVALTMNLDFQAAGVFGARPALADEVMPLGPLAGYTAAEVLSVARETDPSEAGEDLLRALEYFNVGYQYCDATEIPEPSDTCGNSTLDEGEECDDGNLLSHDGCSPTCTFEFCGDGELQCHEECDDGNNVDGDGCSARCMVEVEEEPVDTGLDTGMPVDTGVVDPDDGSDGGSDGGTDDGDDDGTPGGGGGSDDGGTSGGGGSDGGTDGGDDDGATGGGGGGSDHGDTSGGGSDDEPTDDGDDDGTPGGGGGSDDGGSPGGDDATDGEVPVDTGLDEEPWDTGIDDTGAPVDDDTGTEPDETTAVCGDGYVEGLEDCDDGNLEDGDGCTASCELEFCGPGAELYDRTLPDTPTRMGLGVTSGEGARGLSVSINNALPGHIVWFLASPAVDPGGCPWLMVDACSELEAPELLGYAVADGTGRASVDAELPDLLDRYYVQAVVMGIDAPYRSLLAAVQTDGTRVSVCPDLDCGDGAPTPADAEAECSDELPRTPRGMIADGTLPGQPGDTTVLTSEGAIPGDTVVFILGPPRMTGPCPWLYAGIYLDTDAPRIAGVAVADADGVATLVIPGDAEVVPQDGDVLQTVVPVGADSYASEPVILTHSCGDGVLAPAAGEQCDDGNVARGDGCSETCTFEDCGDGMKRGQEECDDGNLVDGDGCSTSCVLERCGDGELQPELGEECDDGNRDRLDGCGRTCLIEACGDGVLDLEYGEECDDGNAEPHDGCNQHCVIEYCGDGIIQDSEQCDDGNTEDGDACPSTCVYPSCGDGLLEGDEECDDGNNRRHDGCSHNCHLEYCGDGKLQMGEQCDDGNNEDMDGCNSTCQNEKCGDGIVHPWEECDDGNRDSRDGCNWVCQLESCGDGRLQASLGEECDDGNLVSGDGCDAMCILEVCGDGILHVNETCDDGNDLNNDGCSADCAVEVCGDGIQQSSEGCDGGPGCNEVCENEFAAVAAGGRHTCILDLAGELYCFGDDVHDNVSLAPAGSFDEVEAGQFHTCALRGTELTCWGRNNKGQTTVPAGLQVADMSLGQDFTCALTIDGQAVCFGDDRYGQATAPGGEFLTLSAGGDHACGLRPSGAIDCWGRDRFDAVFAPAATNFVDVSAGGKHTCAVRTNGSVECWGYRLSGRLEVPDTVTDTVQVLAGNAHSCARDSAGMVTCWGFNDDGQTEPPDIALGELSGRWDHVCAVVPGTTEVACWGNDQHGRSTPRTPVAD